MQAGDDELAGLERGGGQAGLGSRRQCDAQAVREAGAQLRLAHGLLMDIRLEWAVGTGGSGEIARKKKNGVDGYVLRQSLCLRTYLQAARESGAPANITGPKSRFATLWLGAPRLLPQQPSLAQAELERPPVRPQRSVPEATPAGSLGRGSLFSLTF